MLLRRFYDEKLAQASYLVGCSATGEALVVDPVRDAAQYVEAADREGLRITHVTETHIHADFASGSRELARLTGATLYLSDEGDENWKYAFAAEAGAVPLKDGDSFRVGNVRIDAMHTPGHTPEHMSFVVTDTAAADLPMGVFTGDFVFVGDVGRPDLLEKAAKVAGTMEAGARTLYRSLQKFASRVPEWVQLWPGHGAGSACGKALGAVPSTTLGYERRFNWGFQHASEDEFVAAVLAGQPEPPMYFAQMKRINKEGPALLGGSRTPARLQETRLEALLDAGAVVVDTRHFSEFAQGHVPGTLNVPLGRDFTTWAGSVIPYGREFYLIVDDDRPDAADEAVRDLALIGLDAVGGWFGAEVVDRWVERHQQQAESIGEITADELEARLAAGTVSLIDVRNSSEWEEGRIPGSLNLPLSRLTERLDEVPRDRPLVVHCRSGARAEVAIGMLQSSGVRDILHLSGDFLGWEAGGRRVERGREAAVAA